jgi:hypothetical protein
MLLLSTVLAVKIWPTSIKISVSKYGIKNHTQKQWLFFPENIGKRLSIDETFGPLNTGELSIPF